MTFRLELVSHFCDKECRRPHYAVVGRNYGTRQRAQSAKRGYSFARSGVVRDAKELAKRAGLRSPWRVVEEG